MTLVGISNLMKEIAGFVGCGSYYFGWLEEAGGNWEGNTTVSPAIGPQWPQLVMVPPADIDRLRPSELRETWPIELYIIYPFGYSNTGTPLTLTALECWNEGLKVKELIMGALIGVNANTRYKIGVTSNVVTNLLEKVTAQDDRTVKLSFTLTAYADCDSEANANLKDYFSTFDTLNTSNDQLDPGNQ